MESWIANPVCTNFKSVYDRYELYVPREIEGVYITQALNDLVNYWRQGALQPKEHESYFINTALPKIATRMVRTRYINETLTHNVYFFIRKTIDIAIELMPLNIGAFSEFLVYAFDHSSAFFSSKNLPVQFTTKFPDATFPVIPPPTAADMLNATKSPRDTASPASAQAAVAALEPSSTTSGDKGDSKDATTPEIVINDAKSPPKEIDFDDEPSELNPYASLYTSSLHYPSQYFPDLLNFFGALGGFKKMFEHMALETTPVVIISNQLHSLRNAATNGFLLPRRLAQFTPKVLQIPPITRGLSSAQLKAAKKEDLENMLRHLGLFLKLTTPSEEVADRLDQLGLRIAAQCLSSGILTQRLFALSFLGSAIDAVLPRTTTNSSSSSGSTASNASPSTTSSAAHTTTAPSTSPLGPLDPQSRWLNIHNLVEWIRNSQILVNIFGDSSHSQLLKNSGKLLRFLAQHDGLTLADVELIWKCGSNSHESLANDALSVFFEICGYISSPLMEPVLKSIDASVRASLAAIASMEPMQREEAPLPLANVDLNNIATLANRLADDSQRMRLVHLLLLIVQESPVRLVTETTPHLVEIFKTEWFKPHRLEILAGLLQVLQDETFPSRSFYCSLIDPIVGSWTHDDPTTSNSIASITAQLGMPLEDFLIEELVTFKETCRPHLTDTTYGTESVVLAGCTTYIKELQNRLYLLYHIFVQGQGQLTRESVMRLWDTLYQGALNYAEAEEAAEWFKAASAPGTLAITPSLADQLFQARFMHLDFTIFSTGLYSCFERFFIHSNIVMQNLAYLIPKAGQQQAGETDFEVSTHPDKLIGESCLWDIALMNPDTNVVQACMKLLIKCMEQLNPTLQLEISPVELREHFIGKCLGRIPDWVAQYKSVSIAELESSNSMADHKMQLEKFISNALYLLVHLMDSLEPAASKRSTITRGMPLSLRVETSLEIPTPMNPSDAVNANFTISCESSTTFNAFQALVASRLDPLLKKHKISAEELVYVQTYPWYRRLDHDVSISEATLANLELYDKDAIRVLHLPSIAGRETVLRSRKGHAFKNEDKARPADAEARIQQICEFAEWSAELAEFALKSHAWDVEQVGNSIMDEGRRMKLLNEAKKAGVGKHQQTNEEGAPTAKEIVQIMKQRTDAVLSIMDDSQSNDISLPSIILSSNKLHFDALFGLLTLNNDSVSTAVWQIVLRIPTSVSIKASLLSRATPDWSELLPLDVYRLAYTVQIIDQILCPLDDSWSLGRRLEWAIWFQDTGGLAQLLKVVSHFEAGSMPLVDPDATELPLGIQTRRDCLTTLLKILDVFLTCYAESLGLVACEDIPAELSSAIISNADETEPENAGALAPEQCNLRASYTSHLKDTRAVLLPLDCDAALSHLREVLVWGTTSKPQVANGALVGYTWRCFVNLSLAAFAHSKRRAEESGQDTPVNPKLLSTEVLKTALDLLTDLNPEIRRETATNLLHMATLESSVAESLLKTLLHSLPLEKDVKTADLNLAACYDRLYWLLELLINLRLTQLEQDNPGSLFGDAVVQQFTSLADRMIKCICDRPVTETGSLSHVDHLLNGSVRVLTRILSAWPTEYPAPELINTLYNTCMFTAKSSGNVSPKCKTHASRTSTYELLLQLSRLSPENKLQLLTLLGANHTGNYTRVQSWDFHPGNEDKSAAGYVGLVNLGATCYMNSLLQQFYMMPQLRRDLLAAPVVLGPEEVLKENMVYQFHQLFGNLQETAKAAHNPKEFTGSYRDIEGNPADVSMQQDVSEFFSVVCGTLENLLKNTVDEKLLQRNFGCVQVSQIKSMEPEYPFFSEREEDLYAIPLDIHLKNNFSDAMDLFVKQDVLEGDNKYKCDDYGRHIVATKGNLIKTMSNTLIFHLMRFDFDVATYRKRKLNDHFNFPMRINMKKWTKSGQTQMTAEQAGQPINPELAAEFPEEYYDFQLTGILVHTGSADSGHYYSFIKERDAPHKWYQFNDRVVSEFDPTSIPQECFGGYHSAKEWDQHLQKDVWHDVPTERNAYMLFYERVVPLPPKAPASGTASVASDNPNQLPGNRRLLKPSGYTHDVPVEVFNKVWDENANFLKVRQIFDPAYFEFMRDYAGLWTFEPFLHIGSDFEDDVASDSPVLTSGAAPVPVNAEFAAIKMIARLVFEVVSHSKDNLVLTSLLNQLAQMITNHVPAAVWLVEYVRRHNLIKELMLTCHVERTRIAFLDFFRQLMQTLNQGNVVYCPSLITKGTNGMVSLPGPSMPAPADGVFAAAALDLLEESRGAWRRFKQYFALILDYVHLGNAQRSLMLKRGLISTYVDYFMGQSSGGVIRVRVMDEDNFPDLIEFIATITTLVCSCKNENPSADATDVEAAAAASQPSLFAGPPRSRLQIGDLEMPNASKQDLFYATDFFTSLLEMDYNSVSTGDMLEYICWHVRARTDYVLDHLLTKIDVKPSENKAPVLEYLLFRLLSIDDDLRQHRIERVMGKKEVPSSLGKYSMGSKTVKSLLLAAQTQTTFAMLYMVGYLRLIETVPPCFDYLLKNPLDLLFLRKFWRQQFDTQFPNIPCDSHLIQDVKDGLHLYFSAAAELVHPRHPAHPKAATAKPFDDHINSVEPWKRSLPYLALVYCTYLSQYNGSTEPAYEDIVLAQQKQILQLAAQMEELKREKKTLVKALVYVHDHYPTAKLQPKLQLKVEDIIREDLFSVPTTKIANSGRPITAISYLSAATGGSSSGGATSQSSAADPDAAAGATSPKKGSPSASPARPAASGANATSQSTSPAGKLASEDGSRQLETLSMSGAMDDDEEILGIQSYPPSAGGAPANAAPAAAAGNSSEGGAGDSTKTATTGDAAKKNPMQQGILVSSDGSTNEHHGTQSSGEYDEEHFATSTTGWRTSSIIALGAGIAMGRADFDDDFDADALLHGPAPLWRAVETVWKAPVDWEDRVNNLKGIGMCDNDEVLKLLLEENNWSVESAANDLFDPDTLARLQKKAAKKKAENQSTDAGSDTEMDNGEIVRHH